MARLGGDAIRDLQVAFLALSADGQLVSFALLPGFTYAATRFSGKTEVLPSASRAGGR